jgi:heme/copper-type cytochrome/quinol oxidase subunit 4
MGASFLAAIALSLLAFWMPMQGGITALDRLGD